MRKLSLIIVPLVFLFSCNQNRILKEHIDIPDYIWFKSNILEYNFSVEDTSFSYLVSLEIRHATYFLHKNLNISIEMINPQGETANIPISIPLRDNKGNFQGSGLGDIWDYETAIFEHFRFPEAGNYSFQIHNNMEEEKTMAVMEIGLIIEKEVL